MASTTEASLPPATVGWIGLGSMGTGMASRIQKHLAEQGSKPLRVYNRTASRCKPLEDLGARASTSIEELSRESDVIFMSVSQSILHRGRDQLVETFP